MALCGLFCTPCLRGYLLADDFGDLQLYSSLPLAKFFRLFADDVSLGIWGERLHELRPIVAFFYKFDLLIWGLRPFGLHLTNLLLHLGNAVLVYFLVLQGMTNSRMAALVSALAFGLAPCHAEPISWIAGRNDLIPCLFFLSAFLAFLYSQSGSRAFYAVSLVLFIAALFSKESVMVLPLCVTGYVLLVDRGAKLSRLLPYYSLLSVYLLLRMWVFGSVAKEQTWGLGLIPELLQNQIYYLKVLLVPASLEVAAGVPLRAFFTLAIPAALSLAVVGASGHRQSVPRFARQLLFWGPIWYLLTTLPLIITYRSARHLYLPSVGPAICLSLLASRVATGKLQRLRAVSMVALCVFLVLCGALLSYSLGQWNKAGDLSRAVGHSIEAIASQVQPNSILVLAHLPEAIPGTYLWEWSLPFALEPPFSNASRNHQIIEPPEAYCCENWWSARKAVLQQAMTSNGNTTHVLGWDQSMHQFSSVAVSEGEKRRLLEQLNLPLDSRENGVRLLKLLAELVPERH